MTAAAPARPFDPPKAKQSSEGRLVRVYVWELPVRLTHWGIALSIFVLAFTGFYIGRPFLVVPGEARFHFVMGTVKAIHFYAAIVFAIAVLSRIAWMFLGNRYARWNQLLPVSAERLREWWQALAFYLFLRREPPPVVGHSPLAGAAYSVVFLLYLLMIATGFALYSASAALDSPMRVFDFLVPLLGGLQTARWIHHVSMWLLLGFFVHHLSSALLMSILERTGVLDSIFSGYKYLPGNHPKRNGKVWE
jgi:Ni/Fe-hydrogenase 1 B-type cytochrome subunit